MARKVCTAGVAGSFSFMVLDRKGIAVSQIREGIDEIITSTFIDVDFAMDWTERKLRELTRRDYEVDRI